MCLYWSIYTVLRRNNFLQSWTARVCNSCRVSFTFFFEVLGETGGVGRRSLSEDQFLLDWAENISTIELVVEADYSNSFLRLLSRFSEVNKPQPITPRKYPLASSSNSNCTPPSLFPNPSFILSPLPWFLSEFSSSELRPQRLELSELDLSELDPSELDSDQKFLCPSQKPFFFLCFLKNLFFR